MYAGFARLTLLMKDDAAVQKSLLTLLGHEGIFAGGGVGGSQRADQATGSPSCKDADATNAAALKVDELRKALVALEVALNIYEVIQWKIIMLPKQGGIFDAGQGA